MVRKVSISSPAVLLASRACTRLGCSRVVPCGAGHAGGWHAGRGSAGSHPAGGARKCVQESGGLAPAPSIPAPPTQPPPCPTHARTCWFGRGSAALLTSGALFYVCRGWASRGPYSTRAPFPREWRCRGCRVSRHGRPARCACPSVLCMCMCMSMCVTSAPASADANVCAWMPRLCNPCRPATGLQPRAVEAGGVHARVASLGDVHFHARSQTGQQLLNDRRGAFFGAAGVVWADGREGGSTVCGGGVRLRACYWR
jgi:hypothetical protein